MVRRPGSSAVPGSHAGLLHQVHGAHFVHVVMLALAGGMRVYSASWACMALSLLGFPTHARDRHSHGPGSKSATLLNLS